MKYGKIAEPKGKFGNFKERMVDCAIPPKPGGQGPSGTHGSYKKGSPVGTVKHK